MNLAIVITHNKSDKENEAQIEFFKSLITKITDTYPLLDDNGKQVGTYDTYHYEINTLPITHEAKFYQIVPFQPDNKSNPYKAVLPANFNDIDAHNVQYGWGDEDKIGDHARFFNWGLKRGTDYGADIVIHIDDYKTLDFSSLTTDLQKLNDKNNPTELVDKPEVTIGTLKLLTDIGQLDETKTKSEAMIDLKTQIVDVGLEISEVKLG